tara:strand:- start:484 stop:1155 length:672 start_codon:yes stop_codon:yes gene_type:complete
MTDLCVSMTAAEELSAPTDDDKRLIDAIKNAPPEQEDIIDIEEPAEDIAEELELKEIVDEKVIFSDEVTEDPPSPPSKKKKPLSDKQRAHLKKAREKALATRKAKAAERKKVEEAKRVDREKKRLEREQKQIKKEDNDFEKQKKIQETTPPPSQVPSSMRHLSEEDIMKLQQAAIENYEVTRKARKQKKKEAEAKANHDKKVYQSISKAVGQTQEDIWGSCFQ